ncbi:hypothetical protein ACIP8U_44375 [Streptomyces pseudovenezuelae]|uniref:hypothetical protein n=1 Tax=Streptomyces pseudovenezuelae TaxID=67350 RepID=UPI0036E25284
MSLYIGAPVHAAPQAVEHGFVVQAAKAGLTPAETDQLQAEIDAYMTQHGGRQTAINEVALDDKGSFMRMPLPGEARTRDLKSGARSSAGAECLRLYFCAFNGPNFTGIENAWSTCYNHAIDANYIGTGSWINHQTEGTVAQFKSKDGVTRWRDSGAFSADNEADWTWVWYVQPC